MRVQNRPPKPPIPVCNSDSDSESVSWLTTALPLALFFSVSPERYTFLMIVPDVASTAQFSAEKMGKTTLVKGVQLFAGLNCFEAGQQHAMHSHAGQDKLYVVMQGSAEITIGDRRELVSAGGVAFAADGVPHGVKNPGPGRLIVMAILAPPPK